MRVYCLVVAGVLMLLSWARPASALHEWEVWRSPFGVVHRGALDPSDGSLWTGIGDTLYHYGTDHSLLSSTQMRLPYWVGVNSADGSCWVGDWAAIVGYRWPSELVHVSSEGAEIIRVEGFGNPCPAPIAGPDGSIWVWNGDLARVSAGGDVVASITGRSFAGLQTNPSDGTCWTMDFDTGELLHVDPSGGILWQGGSYDPSYCRLSLYYGDGSLWIAELGTGDLLHLSEGAAEISRTPVGAGLAGLVVNQADGTCWASLDSPSPSLVHVGADGTVLGSIPRPAGSVTAVDPITGTFWGSEGERLWHADTDGTELWRSGESFGGVLGDPGTGGCWTWGDTGDLVHFDGDGDEVHRLPASPAFPPYSPGAVNAADGSLYFVSGETATLTRVFRDGTSQSVPLVYAPTVTQPAAASGVGVDPTDDSFWAYVGDGPDGSGGSAPTIIHFAADGSQMGRIAGFWPRVPSAVDPQDGSLWVVGLASGQQADWVAHFAADGAEVWHSVRSPLSLAVDAEEGSCWMALGDKVRRFARDGTLLVTIPQAWGQHARALAVDQHTGCCWAAQKDYVSVYDRSGTQLWQDGDFAQASGVQVDPRDGSVWVNSDTWDHIPTAHGQIVHLWAPTTPFYDVLPGHWAGRAIRMCYEYGIVGGYPDGYYHPEWSVSRAAMAGFISRALAEGDANVPPGPETPHFPDVPTDYWAYKYVEYAYANNIVAGYPNGEYAPEVPVDRGQMAAFIARAIVTPTGEAGLAGYTPPETPTFPDVPTDFWTYKHIEYIKEAGIVGGYPDGRYRPEGVCTRDQMAVFVARAFDLLPY